MKNIFGAILLCGIIFSTAPKSTAALVTVNIDSGSFELFDSNGTTRLTDGTAATGDGAVVQLGYFSAATSAALFAGTWIPLTGQGGANSAYANTSVGDTVAAGAGLGTFAIGNLNFDPAVAGKNANLPAAGVPLGIRIYNRSTIAASTRYITISSSLTSWQWLAPAEPPLSPSINLSLDDAPKTAFRIEDNAHTANGTAIGASPAANVFSATVPVPEPSALLLQGFTAISALCFRKRGRRRF